MVLDKKFLEILVCPTSKQALRELGADRLAILNRVVEQGELQHRDGSPVREPITAALITADGKTVYKVEDEIPILLEDLAIPAHQIPGW